MAEDPGAWTSLVLLERYQAGDDQAAEALFARYLVRLTALARSRLAPRLAGRTDPDDIVGSVYRSFFLGARDGRYSLSRGGDLWRLLAAITKHKLLHHVRHASADRRSVAAEIPLDRVDEPRATDATAAADLLDEVEWILAPLGPFARRVVELRLQGLTLAEIALDTGRAERTVRRTLAEVRARLAARLGDG